MNDQKQRAFDRLKELRAELDQLKYEDRDSGRLSEWERAVKAALKRLFGERSQHFKDAEALYFSPMVITNYTDENDWQESFRSGITRAKSLINAAIQEVIDYEMPESIPAAEATSPNVTRKAFVVHGRDNEMKEAVARFLERLGFSAIVLHEQASGGATVIEKIENNSDVGFAVVLLSPDDVGGFAAEKPDLQPRARQNVVLELGYFLGKLGRSRVVAIMRGKLEIPSDFEGVVYVPFEGEGWKLSIVRELKSIGYDVDANAAF